MFPVTEEENNDQSTTSGQIERNVFISLLSQRILSGGVQGALTVVLVMETGKESLENKMGKMDGCPQVFPLREAGRLV